jgi:hypothetical protein
MKQASDAGSEMLNVVICGGGRTGHLNAILFKQLPGVRVSMLTQNEALIASHREGRALAAMLPDGEALHARLDAVSRHAGEVMGDADMVIITVPAQARPGLLETIAAVLPADKPVHVGAIPGFCGFDWLAEKALADRPNAVIWGMKDVPHTAFDLKPGISVRVGGAKSRLYAAAHRRESAASRKALLGHLQKLYGAPVELLDDYLEITLTPGNPIMHPSVVYGLIGPYGQWHGRPLPTRLRWWTDCPELGAYFLERCDEESQRLCKALEERLGIDLSSVKPLRQEIIEAYQDQIRDQATMLGVLRTNRAYEDIEAPLVPAEECTGYLIDRRSRAFHEDVAYGLALLVGMARRLKVAAPYLEEIFGWHVSYMGGLRASALDYLPSAWPESNLIRMNCTP